MLDPTPQAGVRNINAWTKLDKVLNCKDKQRARNSQDAYCKRCNQVEADMKPEKSSGYVNCPYSEKRNQGSERHLAKMLEPAGQELEDDKHEQDRHSDAQD